MFRARHARDKFKIMQRSKHMNSKYFLQEDLKETLTKQRYSQTRERVKKPAYKFNSGSVYTGEWCGGFRDGHG